MHIVTVAFFRIVQNLGATKASFKRWIDKWVYPEKEVFFRTKKKQSIKACNDIDGT